MASVSAWVAGSPADVNIWARAATGWRVLDRGIDGEAMVPLTDEVRDGSSQHLAGHPTVMPGRIDEEINCRMSVARLGLLAVLDHAGHDPADLDHPPDRSRGIAEREGGLGLTPPATHLRRAEDPEQLVGVSGVESVLEKL